MTDTYSWQPPPGSTGQLPNTDPGVDRPSSTQAQAYCPNCFYVQLVTAGNWTCHRYAPNSQQGAVNWPAVKATDWCGEFRNNQQ